MRRARRLALALALWPALVAAQPSISGVSGTVAHGGTITITGSSFGTKSTAAPVVWEDGSGPTGTSGIFDIWSGCWPSNHATAASNMQRRAYPFANVSAPHARSTKALFGTHTSLGNTGFDAGLNVLCYKTVTNYSRPETWFVSMRRRTTPDWVFGVGAPDNDNNYKEFDWAQGSSPYCGGCGRYMSTIAFASAADTTADWIVETTGDWQGGAFIDEPGTEALNPHVQWVQVMMQTVYTTNPNGRVDVWENNVLKGSRSSTGTDNFSGATRTFTIGGFARTGSGGSPAPGHSGVNTRAFTDVYIDRQSGTTGVPRVVICDSATFTSCTNVEMQIPTAWSSTSITATVNRGALNTGTRYVYVFNSSGQRNASGFAVTMAEGGGGDVTPPVVTITVPTSSPTHGTDTSPIVLGGTATDDVELSSCGWTNDRGGSGSAGLGGGPGGFTTDQITLFTGVNVLTVSCTDTSANSGQDVITVTYTPNPPVYRLRFRPEDERVDYPRDYWWLQAPVERAPR